MDPKKARAGYRTRKKGPGGALSRGWNKHFRAMARAELDDPCEVLTRDDVERLLAVAGRGFDGDRMRALISLLYGCGLRISEVLVCQRHPYGRGGPRLPSPGLRHGDIDWDRGGATIRCANGAHQRVVGIPEWALAHLRIWVQTKKNAGYGKGLLFITDGGRPLKPRYVRQRLPRLAKEAGIERRVHPFVPAQR